MRVRRRSDFVSGWAFQIVGAFIMQPDRGYPADRWLVGVGAQREVLTTDELHAKYHTDIPRFVTKAHDLRRAWARARVQDSSVERG